MKTRLLIIVVIAIVFVAVLFGMLSQTDIYDYGKYRTVFGPGSPLAELDTGNPVLSKDNCERYAYWLSEHQKEKITSQEDFSVRYPPWGNQIFPLVEYCTKTGQLEKTVINDTIRWEFHPVRQGMHELSSEPKSMLEPETTNMQCIPTDYEKTKKCLASYHCDVDDNPELNKECIETDHGISVREMCSDPDNIIIQKTNGCMVLPLVGSKSCGSDFACTEESKPEKIVDVQQSVRFCAYVGAERLSEYELQRIQNNPHNAPLQFLNFTDDHLSKVPALKEIIEKLETMEFPLNDRGYVDVSANELQDLKDYLSSKSSSKTLSSHIVVNDNLYSINGMMSFPIDPNGESLNIQLDRPFADRKDDFTKETIMKNPSKNYVMLTEEELEEIEPIKDAIEQIGTWEIGIRESKDVGDVIQNQVQDFMQSESVTQIGPDPENQTSSFYHNGNYYRSSFVIC
ncbi:MAG: hypothetical protein GKS07_10045 [Nitrosopumilus sp.]|nr:MAG: hypothetical protein GKS07_10045 [Nitrosopumilus sp.]